MDVAIGVVVPLGIVGLSTGRQLLELPLWHLTGLLHHLHDKI